MWLHGLRKRGVAGGDEASAQLTRVPVSPWATLRRASRRKQRATHSLRRHGSGKNGLCQGTRTANGTDACRSEPVVHPPTTDEGEHHSWRREFPAVSLIVSQ